MYYNFQNLFTTKVANEIESLCAMIIDLYNSLEEKGVKLKWTRDKYFDKFGFYLLSDDGTKDLFCGMWFEVWETYGYPFCFCLDGDKQVANSIKFDLEKIISSEQNPDLAVKDFQGFPIVTFNDAFFQNLNDCTPLVALFVKVTEGLKFNIYFNK